MTRRSVVTVGLLTILVVAGFVLYFPHRRRPNPPVAQADADPKSCVQCHVAETAGYATTGMAHAFYRPQAKTTVEVHGGDQPFFHAASGTYYSMTEHGGKYFQRRWQKGFNGKPDNVEELQIDYIMGSGNHVRTYLHREADGTLIEKFPQQHIAIFQRIRSITIRCRKASTASVAMVREQHMSKRRSPLVCLFHRLAL
jgi:hypothetical protein